MITNAEYLIQKLAEATEWHGKVKSISDKSLWRGTAMAYQNILNDAFPGWDAPGTTGHYVLNEGMTYDAAITAANKAFPTEASPHREDPRYWRNAATRPAFSDSDDDYDY